jgi:hypothetical protein
MQSASNFQSEDGLHEVRLEGPLNTYEFWQQPAVLKELKTSLADKLSATPVFSDYASTDSEVTRASALPPTPVSRPSRGFSLFRKKEVSSDSTVAAATTTMRDWSIEVAVDLEEICLRTESHFGLYETITRPAVVVRVNARC